MHTRVERFYLFSGATLLCCGLFRSAECCPGYESKPNSPWQPPNHHGNVAQAQNTSSLNMSFCPEFSTVQDNRTETENHDVFWPEQGPLDLAHLCPAILEWEGRGGVILLISHILLHTQRQKENLVCAIPMESVLNGESQIEDAKVKLAWCCCKSIAVFLFHFAPLCVSQPIKQQNTAEYMSAKARK